LVNSEENKNEIDYPEILMQYAKDLESIAVDLYNNHDFSSAGRLCAVILNIYEKIHSKENIKRLKQVLQKLPLVDQYFDATIGLVKRQIEEKNEKEEVENK
jgi:hypothetical protein